MSVALLALGALAPGALVASAPAPTPDPTEGLREGLEVIDIGPGVAGFFATAAVVLVSILVIVNMVGRLRRLEHRRLADERAEDERRRLAGEPPRAPGEPAPPRPRDGRHGPGSGSGAGSGPPDGQSR
ncbi:hypothetical protein [Pseudokineococcus sp. 1T1Z-3]|uniref:hypothetical protein n=1 Tax=Pseudokineococcus sp. 1T1Z-3 TaxID=3132745 RepID=UPI0030B74395